MNNEPVAYVNSMCNDYIDWKKDPMSIDGQSLYTHPAEHDLGIAEAIGFEKGYVAAQPKTLTDKEIIEIAKDCGYANRYELNIKFARAILRKAQE